MFSIDCSLGDLSPIFQKILLNFATTVKLSIVNKSPMFPCAIEKMFAAVFHGFMLAVLSNKCNLGILYNKGSNSEIVITIDVINI